MEGLDSSAASSTSSSPSHDPAQNPRKSSTKDATGTSAKRKSPISREFTVRVSSWSSDASSIDPTVYRSD